MKKFFLISIIGFSIIACEQLSKSDHELTKFSAKNLQESSQAEESFKKYGQVYYEIHLGRLCSPDGKAVSLIWLNQVDPKGEKITKDQLNVSKENYQKELVQLQSDLKKQQKHLDTINKKFSGKAKLFHTDAEVEGLYETLSTLALEYKLTVSKLERDKETPVYKTTNNSENNNQKNENKQIDYYKILVKYQVTGNYLRYMNFKESIANMDKIVHFEKEEIKVMPKKKGIVIADGVLSVIRLP